MEGVELSDRTDVSFLNLLKLKLRFSKVIWFVGDYDLVYSIDGLPLPVQSSVRETKLRKG